ncbi:MAG: MBL fold metallo-hydrolase [Thermodesulfobacteriota bacterium]
MAERGSGKREMPARITEHAWALGTDEHLCYLVAGSRESVLVEGGVSAVVPVVFRQMAGVPGAPPLRRLIATHSHADHSTGLLAMKKENPGLLLCATEETGRVLANDKIRARLLAEDEFYSELLLARGEIAAHPGPLSVSSVRLDRTLHDGEVLDLGGASVIMVETPGHAPGALSAWVLPDRLLLLSDSAGFSDDGKRIYPMFFQDLGLYLSSLERLASLAPEALGLGHHLIVEGRGACASFLKAAGAEALKMARDMKSREDAGEDRDAVAKAWADRLREYPFFAEFPEDSLMSYARLLCRRSVEEAVGLPAY